MAKQVIFRRGTTAQHATFVGANGEITVDTVKHVAVIHDGKTTGGWPLANAAQVNSSISSLTANAANQAASIVSLTANAAAQSSAIAALQSNAATQQASIEAFTLASNATSIFANIADVRANLLAAHANIALLTGYNVVREESITLANANIIALQSTVANITGSNLEAVSTSIIPTANVTYDLGSSDYRWRDLYLSGNTINLGGTVISTNGQGGLSVPGGISTGGSIVGIAMGSAEGVSSYIGGTVTPDQQTLVLDSPWDPGYSLDPVLVGPNHSDYDPASQIGTNATFTFNKSGTAINSITLASGGSGYVDYEDIGVYFFRPNPAEAITITGVVDPESFPDPSYLGEFIGLVYPEYHPVHTATIDIDGDTWEITYVMYQRPGYEWVYDPSRTSVRCNGSTVVDPIKLSKLANNGNGLYVHYPYFNVLTLEGSQGVGDQAMMFMLTFDKQWPGTTTIQPIVSSASTGTQGSTSIVGQATITGNTTTSNLAVSGTITFGDNTVQTSANIMLAAFTMANSQHWTEAVTTIGDALNQVAARLYAAGF
jgi:hypothetical protein